MADAQVDQLRGLPMDELIGAPLTASCKAQYNLAKTMVAFINEIGFTKKGEELITRTLDFDLTRPVDNGTGKLGQETVAVKAPLLGLVPIPALLIESVNINFTMELKSTTKDTTKDEAKASLEATGSWGWGSATVKGEVSTQRENTRTTDNTAKYEVNVVARQQQPQEGMSKLMDLMASAVEPISAKYSAPA